MANVVLYFPGNGTHSFQIENRFEKMYKEKLGIKTLGESGFPIAISNQGIDHDLFPFLKEMYEQYDNLEIVGAPYGHGLLPLIRFNSKKQTSKQLSWENNHGIRGNVPVTFFSEFYNPSSNIIPTEYFFVLKEQTCSYSLEVTGINIEKNDLSNIPESATAVNYNGKIGILIQGFNEFVKAWFKFAANPSSENISKLMLQFDKLANDPREYIVVPLDLEQPWVGSFYGEELFRIFFKELSYRKSSKKVVSLSSILKTCKEKAVNIHQPHRILTKWTVHDIQFKTIMDLNSLSINSDKERRIFSLAFSSDHLSSLNRMALSSTKKIKPISAFNLKAEERLLSQDPNHILQNCCNAAYMALRHKDKNLRERLDDLTNKNFFVERLISWAKKYEL